MNKSILGVILITIVVVGVIWIARPKTGGNDTASVVNSSGGSLFVDEKRFDFGTISMAAGEVKHEFKVKNTGASPVIIGKMYTSCMCTVATLIKGGKKFGPYGMPGHGYIPKINETLNVGEEVTVEVVFDPAAHGPAGVGRVERAVVVENSAGQPLEFGFTVMVTP